MNEYDIEIVETLSTVITEKGKDYQEALDKVMNDYYDGKIILDYENKTDTDFLPFPDREIEKDFDITISYDRHFQQITIYNNENKNDFIKDSCIRRDEISYSINNYIDKYISFNKIMPSKKNIKDNHREER